MTLGEVIKAYRTKYQLSLRQFAAQAGLSYGYIGMLERGRTSRSGASPVPTITAYSGLAKAMGLTVQQLMEMVDEDSPVALSPNPLPANAIPVSKKRIPLLGSIVGAGTGLVALLLGCAWSLVIIAIGWIRFRPLLGICLLGAAVALIAFLIVRGRKRKASAPVQA